MTADARWKASIGTAGNGKAGHTNESWFAGYTPQLSTAVWVGTPNDKQNKVSLLDFHLGKTFYPREVFGATIAGPIWKQIGDSAHPVSHPATSPGPSDLASTVTWCRSSALPGSS